MPSLLAKANGPTINYLKMVFSLWPQGQDRYQYTILLCPLKHYTRKYS